MGLGCTVRQNATHSWGGVRGHGGFTLIELMMTLSIIGILASIALPNFQNFQSRARQAEARVTLSALYVAETSFFADQGSYTTCLTDAGYGRLGVGHFYTVGFVDSQSTCGPTGAEPCHTLEFTGMSPCQAGAFPAGATFLADRGAATTPVTLVNFNANATTSATSNTFRVGVVGQISGREPTLVDVWSITESKVIINDKVGL